MAVSRSCFGSSAQLPMGRGGANPMGSRLPAVHRHRVGEQAGRHMKFMNPGFSMTHDGSSDFAGRWSGLGQCRAKRDEHASSAAQRREKSKFIHVGIGCITALQSTGPAKSVISIYGPESEEHRFGNSSHVPLQRQLLLETPVNARCSISPRPRPCPPSGDNSRDATSQPQPRRPDRTHL